MVLLSRQIVSGLVVCWTSGGWTRIIGVDNEAWVEA
jgi:hypothetical protein